MNKDEMYGMGTRKEEEEQMTETKEFTASIAVAC